MLIFWLEIDLWFNPGLMIVDVPQGGFPLRIAREK
jgi:hypothetical protein